MTQLELKVIFAGIYKARTSAGDLPDVREKLGDVLDLLRDELSVFDVLPKEIAYDAGDYSIDGVVISDESMEAVGYSIVEVEGAIEDLERLICEVKSTFVPETRKSELPLIERDLESLKEMDMAAVEWALSSRSTNEYVCHEGDPEKFLDICDRLLSVERARK